MERGRFDCVVVGGGIAGAGIACEAARRGLRVALLEAMDFASGTSSRSTKLIHGGLRYLALGDLELVRETALERKVIRRMAPHLAIPTWSVLPVKGRAALAAIKLGVATYERLGQVSPDDRHQTWNTRELAQYEPVVDRKRYPRACAYREYLTDDARLVIANLRSAVAAGACVANYARVVGLEPVADGHVVHARCELSQRTLRLGTRAVFNAAGPWLEQLRQLESQTARPVLQWSKGVHLVVSAERLPVRNMLMLRASDARYLFAIRRGLITYLGTTDTPYPSKPTHWPQITRQDVEYLLAEISACCAVPALTPGDCLGAWSGLRALVAQAGKRSVEVSRKDELFVGPSGMVSIAGGKLTGYRRVAQRALAKASECLPGTWPAAMSSEQPLPGGAFDGNLETLTHELEATTQVSAPQASRLACLYGSEASRVFQLDPAPLSADAPVMRGEVAWAVLNEGAATLEDVIYRRLLLATNHPELVPPLIEPIAQRMAKLLQWSEQETRSQLSAVRARRRHDLTFADEIAA